MSGPQRKELALVDSATASLPDKALFIINNKVRSTAWQNIYNLFKQGYDTLYATTAQLANYITVTQLNAGLATKQDKQSLTIVNINAQGLSALTSANCILSITNISSGTGNKQINIDGNGFIQDNDFLELTVKYKGFDVNLRSYSIESGILQLFLNVHSNPTEPVIISMNKIN